MLFRSLRVATASASFAGVKRHSLATESLKSAASKTERKEKSVPERRRNCKAEIRAQYEEFKLGIPTYLLPDEKRARRAANSFLAAIVFALSVAASDGCEVPWA